MSQTATLVCVHLISISLSLSLSLYLSLRVTNMRFARRVRYSNETNRTVPFDEDEKKAGIWFLDHNYHETMYGMFKKVNGTFAVTAARSEEHSFLRSFIRSHGLDAVAAREKLVGWYSTGPKIRASDLDINNVFRRYPTPDVRWFGLVGLVWFGCENDGARARAGARD